VIGLAGAVPTVVTKELQLRLRGWRWAGVTTLYAGILAVIAFAFLLHQYSLVASESRAAGIHLFQALALGEMFLIVFVTPASLAGTISGERQHRTWDLLEATPTSMASIVWGKLLAGVLFNLLLVSVSLPFFALVFLFGGVTLASMISTVVVFVVTIILLGSVSLAISALTARLTVSYMVSMAVALALVVGLSLAALYGEANAQLGPISIGSVPFLAGGSAAPLSPPVQLDPLVAVLATLPGDSGGSLLGGLGIIHHAFGLPWTLPLWGAYLVLSLVLSLLLILATIRLAEFPLRFRRTAAVPVDAGVVP
jgi:ABC-type transport system involved in multi-copper enzyme maturation permease subunit